MKNTKVFSVFLPQFHTIPENDEWWGKGFTEWENVKKAEALFSGHEQPQVPLEGYYDLSEVATLRRQSELARKYEISGFCFYHYYSCGKMLLEKPAENLLNEEEINIEYFFSWANHDWRRTWYEYNNELLFEQKYGGEQEILAHYDYVTTFFKDRRYLKIENKPVFFIYRSDLVKDFSMMKKIWNQRAKEDGFDGVFFVSTITGKGVDRNANEYDAYFAFEPDAIQSTRFSWLERKVNSFRVGIIPRINKLSKKKFFRQKFDYRKLAKKSVQPIKNIDKPYFQGAFARWDNTPRHSYNGRIVLKTSKEMFRKVMCDKINNKDKNALPFVIINSWNEWSEGSNIEPNTVDKYVFLEAIKEAMND